MNRLFLTFAIVTIGIFSSCHHRDETAYKNKRAEAQKEIRQTDSAFCELRMAKGMGEAFIHFADSNVIKLNDGAFATTGLKNLVKKYLDTTYKKVKIKWGPSFIEVAGSTDLGYSFGNWQFADKRPGKSDTTYYGNYITIWKKQKDGTWKYVLDGGSNTPKPKS